MSRYHISASGKPAVCKAEKGACPLGAEVPHFEGKDPQEAMTAYVDYLSEKYNVTSPVSKSQGRGESKQAKKSATKTEAATKKTAKKTIKKPAFTVPPSREIEGYMGMPGFVGGNRDALGKKIGGYVTNKEVAKALRGDVKKAVAAGYLPKTYNGAPLKYSISSPNNSVNFNAVVQGGTVEGLKPPELHFGSWGYGPRSPRFEINRGDGELIDKMGEMSDSYNYDGSNAMVDYFDRGFYGSSKIESGAGSFKSIDRAEKKVSKSMQEDVFNGGDESESSIVSRAEKSAQAHHDKVQEAFGERAIAHKLREYHNEVSGANQALIQRDWSAYPSEAEALKSQPVQSRKAAVDQRYKELVTTENQHRNGNVPMTEEQRAKVAAKGLREAFDSEIRKRKKEKKSYSDLLDKRDSCVKSLLEKMR